MNRNPNNFYLFKTSVQNSYDIYELTPYLNGIVISGSWSFDLEDCDNVLCLTCDENTKLKVEVLLRIKGFVVEELNYNEDELLMLSFNTI